MAFIIPPLADQCMGESMDEDTRWNTRAELAREIRGRAHITGRFTLRSGMNVTEYFDKYQFESDPKLLLAEALAGLELGGVPLATMLSQITGLPALFVRKAAKSYGTRRVAEGSDVAGQRIVVVEDVTTTAGQIVESALHLRDEGGIVNHAVVVVDRAQGSELNLASHGIELRSLFSADDILSA